MKKTQENQETRPYTRSCGAGLSFGGQTFTVSCLEASFLHARTKACETSIMSIDKLLAGMHSMFAESDCVCRAAATMPVH